MDDSRYDVAVFVSHVEQIPLYTCAVIGRLAVQKLGKEDFANENLEKWFWNRRHVYDRFRMEPEQILKVRY